MRVLLIEDEARIAAFIKRGLGEEGYVVDIASDGEEGMAWLANCSFDLIIMDVMLPKMDGLTLCRTIRNKRINSPVLMLTAKDSVEDIVEGLDAGADDYLVKPFAFQELLSRLRAIVRRQNKKERSDKLVVKELEMDLVTRQIVRDGQEIDLTNKEFSLLELFMRNPERVLSRTIIAEHIWNYDFYNQSNVIDVYVRQLRKKMDDPFDYKFIRTVRGSGYKLQGGS